MTVLYGLEQLEDYENIMALSFKYLDGLPSNNVNDILVDNDGVWICQMEALQIIKTEDLKLLQL